MKIPESPPKISTVFKKYNPTLLLHLLEHETLFGTKGRYLHWEKLKYLPLPKGITSHELWWMTIKMARKGAYRKLPFSGIDGLPLQYIFIDSFPETLHDLDRFASGNTVMEKPILNPQLKDYHLINALIEEAITSSQLEGASTTRNIAKKMLQTGRLPGDNSEKMIFNNYQAMNLIRQKIKHPLTPNFICEIHSTISKETLNREKTGQFRDESDDIHIVADNRILFTPPQHTEIKTRIKELCAFANEDNSSTFIHPVIKAVILHFVFAYIHPFVDGNGRTARALFYWFMLKKGYWMTGFISISAILRSQPAMYGYAFLFSETDENDITYFIDHQLQVLKKAMDHLKTHIRKTIDETASTERLLQNTKLASQLNFRQLTLLRSALKEPGSTYTIQEFRNTHNVVYQTARNDLLELSDQYHLLEKVKRGKSFLFITPSDLSIRIRNARKP